MVVLWPYCIVGLGLYLGQSAWLAMGGYHLGMMIGLGLMGLTWRRPHWPWPGRVQLLVGLTFIGSLAAGLLLLWVWSWVVKLPDQTLEPLLARWGLSIQNWPAFAGYFCLVNPWLEELYWRGKVDSLSRRSWETAAWFAGYHGLVLMPVLYGWAVILTLIGLTLVSWWWQRLFKWGSGLTGPILCHLAADVSLMLALTWQLAP